MDATRASAAGWKQKRTRLFSVCPCWHRSGHECSVARSNLRLRKAGSESCWPGALLGTDSICAASVTKSGSKGLLHALAEGLPGAWLSVQRLPVTPREPGGSSGALPPRSSGLLSIIWGYLVYGAWELLFKQLAGNGDGDSLNSLLITDQWAYCEKIEYRCKLYLIKELNVCLTFLFCLFSTAAA